MMMMMMILRKRLKTFGKKDEKSRQKGPVDEREGKKVKENQVFFIKA